MLDFLKFFSNPYDIKARLCPTLLCIFPLFFSLPLLIPNIFNFATIWGKFGVFLYGVIIYLFIQIGRDRGKSLEITLFQYWGGKPSVAMLRHSDIRLNKSVKGRYRNFLEKNVPELTLASEEDEKKNPEQANDGYESATSWLLAKTRDHKYFDLLFQENINYGFRRNTWALKPYAFAIEIITIVIIAFVTYNFWTGELVTTIQTISGLFWVSLVCNICHMLFFIFKVRMDWVELTANAYAQQLLAACDVLASQSISSSDTLKKL